jgi:hypothetical protein
MTKRVENWLEKAAAQSIEEISPAVARSCKILLDAGQTPTQIMRHLKKRYMDVGFLGLVEMALAHWNEK